MCLRRGEERSQNGERAGQRGHREPERCVWVLVSEGGSAPSLGSRLICLLAQRRQLPGTEVYNGAFQPWSMWNKQTKAHNAQCMSSAFVPGSRSFPSTMINCAESKHEVWQGNSTVGRGEKCGKWPGGPEGVRTAHPFPRAKHLEKSTQIQNNSAAQAPPTDHKCGPSDLPPRRSPTDQTEEDSKWEGIL